MDLGVEHYWHRKEGGIVVGADPIRASSCTSYLDSWYRSGAEWALWCVLESKKPQAQVTAIKPTPNRIDSGIDLNVLSHRVSDSSTPVHEQDPATIIKKPKDPKPLSLTFHFHDRIFTKTLDYRIFSRWENIAELLAELGRDGISVHHLWEGGDDMQIGSGDWEARVRPGCEVDVWCYEPHNHHADHADHIDYSDSESEDEAESEDVKMDMSCQRGEMEERKWWFARWKERVERRKASPKAKAHQETSWIMVLVWVVTMLFCIYFVIVPTM
jgi:hypothetical protein